MSTAQRVSRGFHRLAIFLAAITLLVGGAWSVLLGLEEASGAQRSHEEAVALVCAREALYKKFYSDLSREEFERRLSAKLAPIETGEVKVTDPDLKELGCSEWSKRVSVSDVIRARPADDFSWAANFFPSFAFGLAISLGSSLVLYGLVRAIGWVIGGFVVS